MIRVGKHRLCAEDSEPFIIAEIGSNFCSLDDCMWSIQQAAGCGASAVKFQLFTPQDLYGLSDAKIADDPDGKHRLKPEWLPSLKAQTDLSRVEFLCSAFSPELIRVVDPFVNAHKVASFELSHIRMLETLKEIGKPVFLSTGAAHATEIQQALAILRPTPTILMYCVSAYPARLIDFRVMTKMRKEFKCPVGFSDHTMNVLEIPPHAPYDDGVILEKHVTFIEAQTPDSTHSLTEAQFQKMVTTIKGLHHPVGIGPTSEEGDAVLKHRRRLIATRTIWPGETLKENENFGIYRSIQPDTRGLNPFDIKRVEGKRAKNAIPAGAAIGAGDFE